MKFKGQAATIFYELAMTKRPTRGGLGGQRHLKVRLKSARRRTPSSQRWLERQLNDPYVAAAKREGYRSRAAYKLIEIDDKFRFLKPGQRVVDLGAAPGGWSQVAANRVQSLGGRGQVVAIDIVAMEAIAGVEIVHLDFLDEQAPAQLQAVLRDGGADLVLSDLAPPATGHGKTDHLRTMALVEAAAEFALEVLALDGTFLAKVFQGGTERELLARLKREFASVRHVKPPASRSDSSELYVLATGFHGGLPG
jgi:23S rRNA (uridine2552-2'-O)-methyltransferase